VERVVAVIIEVGEGLLGEMTPIGMREMGPGVEGLMLIVVVIGGVVIGGDAVGPRVGDTDGVVVGVEVDGGAGST
jgi:hypothetical protein